MDKMKSTWIQATNLVQNLNSISRYNSSHCPISPPPPPPSLYISVPAKTVVLPQVYVLIVLNEGMDSEAEKRICRIIKKIQANRNTASYQSILAFAKREDKKLTMDNIKESIKDLIAREIMENAIHQQNIILKMAAKKM